MLERIRQTGRSRDEGTSLIKLLVSMIVFGIALGMIYTIVVLVQTKTGKVEASANAVSELRQGLAQIDRQVRSGNVLYAPGNEAEGPARTAGCTTPVGKPDSGTCMRIYTQADGDARCVQWQVRPDVDRPGTAELRSRSWLPSWQTSGSGSVTGWRVDARGLSVAPAVSPFTLVGGSAFGARLLAVHFEAVDPRRALPIVITSSLSGRNTNYGYDAGQCTPVPAA